MGYLYLFLPSISGERLCNATVSVRPSVLLFVCLSVLSIDSSSDVQLIAAARAPAPVRSSEWAASMLWSEEDDRHKLAMPPP